MDIQVVSGIDANSNGATRDDDSVSSGSSSESSVGEELEVAGASGGEEEPESETPSGDRLCHLLGHLWRQMNLEPEQVAEYMFYLVEEPIIPGHQLEEMDKNGRVIPDPRQLIMEEMGEESVCLFARAALHHFGGYENKQEEVGRFAKSKLNFLEAAAIAGVFVNESYIEASRDAAEMVFNDARGRHDGDDEDYDVE